MNSIIHSLCQSYPYIVAVGRDACINNVEQTLILVRVRSLRIICSIYRIFSPDRTAIPDKGQQNLPYLMDPTSSLYDSGQAPPAFKVVKHHLHQQAQNQVFKFVRSYWRSSTSGPKEEESFSSFIKIARKTSTSLVQCRRHWATSFRTIHSEGTALILIASPQNALVFASSSPIRRILSLAMVIETQVLASLP